ncbi:MAG TPA: response regulator [Thermodesulfovibrionales bacterium]|nr:response regulator [Thermodesulfovibrionales bacterium]
MSEGSDKRGEKRILLHLDVVVNGILKASALDISEGGMYIHTPAEFIEGAVLDLKVDIDEFCVNLKAVVQHSQPGIGVGVRFVDLSPTLSDLIKGFIKRGPSLSIKEDREGARRILLVDDSAQSRAIYRNKLNLEGFAVTDASNGVEALKYLHERKFDLVVLDLWMEGIDGFKVLQLMKVNPAFNSIPVIVLSARSVPGDIQRAIDLGARDYLPKMTTTPIKLAEKVKEVLGKSK